MNYYNEFDPYAAAWLRNLIAAGHIPAGDVDERSIADVSAADLEGYAQCHFFAGIGGWSRALALAGWPEDRPVWTGSCPCQPFSAAGKGEGTADPRHLWPTWFGLIAERRPAVVFGEQVDAAIRHGWLDLVQADLEGCGYAFAAAGIPAAGVGAPHIRQRLWFVADADQQQRDGQRNAGAGRRQQPADNRSDSGLADANDARSQGRRGVPGRADQCAVGAAGVAGGMADTDNAERRADMARGNVIDRRAAGRQQGDGELGADREGGGLADAAASGRREERADAGGITVGDRAEGRRAGFSASGSDSGLADADEAGRSQQRGGELLDGKRQAQRDDVDGCGTHDRPGPPDHFWRDADWLYCRDGKWRPVEPGTFPLAHGIPGRVGRLRAYGNAIVPQVAAEFIKAYDECRP